MKAVIYARYSSDNQREESRRTVSPFSATILIGPFPPRRTTARNFRT